MGLNEVLTSISKWTKSLMWLWKEDVIMIGMHPLAFSLLNRLACPCVAGMWSFSLSPHPIVCPSLPLSTCPPPSALPCSNYCVSPSPARFLAFTCSCFHLTINPAALADRQWNGSALRWLRGNKRTKWVCCWAWESQPMPQIRPRYSLSSISKVKGRAEKKN